MTVGEDCAVRSLSPFEVGLVACEGIATLTSIQEPSKAGADGFRVGRPERGKSAGREPANAKRSPA